jgi:hypothetical protein
MGEAGGFSFEDLAESLDLVGRPMGDVGESAVVDLAVLAEALAEEDGGRGVAVGDYGDVHVDIVQLSMRSIKTNISIYMTTQSGPNRRKSE